MPFLEDSKFTPSNLELKVGNLVFDERYYGKGCRLEIIVGSCQNPASCSAPPPHSDLKKGLLKAYLKQKEQRSYPVLAIVRCEGEILVCGPHGEKAPSFNTSNAEAVKRICLYALHLTNPNVCIRYLQDTLPLLTTELPGIRNEGLLSTHELQRGVRQGKEWEKAQKYSLHLLGNRRAAAELLEGLGYVINEGTRVSILSTQKGKIAIALLLSEESSREAQSSQFNDYTPLAYAFAEARHENLPWVFILQGDKIRIYSTDGNFGISKNPPDTSFIELCLAALDERNSGFLWMLFSSKALIANGYIYKIKEQSDRYAERLSDDLRASVYGDVMPSLVQGVMEARNTPLPDRAEFDLVYEIAINILYRLLLVAYAEDRNFLPYANNSEYKERSLKQKAIYLSSQPCIDQEACHHWTDIQSLWEAIYAGNKEFGLPEYGGSILSKDKSESEIGHCISQLKIKNKFLVPALQHLLLTETGKRLHTVDFRSLSIREFGSIYEVMLEKEVTLAKEDVMDGDDLVARKGEVYIHNQSGTRKMSGSFYTPEPLVNYLLDKSLEPALTEHLAKLDDCPDKDLPDKLFDFSVADIAMGSGHFLIAAIDRIERRFTEWLRIKESRSIKNLVKKLEKAASENMKACSAPMEIDTRNILRRVIAYRCIYGVDINRPAVTLARLSVWLHTFVPGLPLFLLDRNLKQGNSLIGIASVDDIRNSLDKDNIDFFDSGFSSYFSRVAGSQLKKLASMHFTSIKDIKNTKRLLAQVQEQSQEVKKLLDLLIARKLTDDPEIAQVNFETWNSSKKSYITNEAYTKAKKLLADLDVVHFPLSFPEVFAQEDGYFDVVVGNPPWQKIKITGIGWLVRYFPGLKSKPVEVQRREKERIFKENPDLYKKYITDRQRADYLRKVILSGNYPGIGKGDPDYFMAFAWRFMAILKNKGGSSGGKGRGRCGGSDGNFGRIGVVMPRSICISVGTYKFRKMLFEDGWHMSLLTLQNKSHWVFKNVHGSYTIALMVLHRPQKASRYIDYYGHKSTAEEFFSTPSSPMRLYHKDLFKWNPILAIPIIPNKEDPVLLNALYRHPRLSDCHNFHALPFRELDITADKDLLRLAAKGPASWPVYYGKSVNIYDCDSNCGTRAVADPNIVLPHLQKKRINSGSNSVWSKFSKGYLEDPETLPAHRPRIAFREVTGATNRRTIIACLVPPHVFLVSTGVLVLPEGDEKDEAYLLGILCSMPLDWPVRRFVENRPSFYLMRGLPIPRLSRSDPVWLEIINVSGRLAARDLRFSDWAKKVGVHCGPYTDQEKAELLAKLDALSAIAYGLTEKQLVYIYDTFHRTSQEYYKEHRKKAILYYRKLIGRTK